MEKLYLCIKDVIMKDDGLRTFTEGSEYPFDGNVTNNDQGLAHYWTSNSEFREFFTEVLPHQLDNLGET